jgi:orotate phosphoribosyltransferase
MVMIEEISIELIKQDIVEFRPSDPFTFTSGIKSPIYTDCKRITAYVGLRDSIVEGLSDLVKGQSCDGFCGTESAGISWAAFLADRLNKPMLYARKVRKGHGMGKRIEGTFDAGQKYVAIEDLVSTGGSLLSAVEGMRDEGIIVEDCLTIFSYNFISAKEAFEKAGLKLHTLCNIDDALESALKLKKLSSDEVELVKEWRNEPDNWQR